MRRLLTAALGTALVAVPVFAQRPASGSSASAAPVPSALADTIATTRSATGESQFAYRAKLRTQLFLLHAFGEDQETPPAERFLRGSRSIPAGATVAGPLGIAEGDLDVFGHVNGDVVVLGGNVIVHAGGEITGDAMAVDGHVRVVGGRVTGDTRSMNGFAAHMGATPAAPPMTTLDAVKLVIGWFAVLFIIGVGVMVFAETNLEGVVVALERGFGRAFWLGLLGQVALLPVLLLLIVGLALTIIGVLLVPFAIVAYVIAVIGGVTLGFLAVARLTGGAIVRPRAATPRALMLGALFAGLLIYLALWMIAAVFTWSPVAGSVLRGIAIAVSWVAATLGFGAAIASRAGTQRPGAARPAPRPADDLAWMTPTPVTGVAAARRPAVSAPERH